ncbi:MAG: preprotein translocase subunit SecG [Sphingomonadaceae bacterium]
MMTFLLVVHGLLALALVGVILMQKSEGGGLTGGGSAGGLVSARGAADLLTRTTAILAALFILSSLGLAMLANSRTTTRPIDTSLARGAPPIASDLPVVPAEPATTQAPQSAAPEAANEVPLAQ